MSLAGDSLLTLVGGNHYVCELSTKWWVEAGPNGGYLASILLRAAQAAELDGRQPRSLTVHMLRAAKAGVLELDVELARRGEGMTSLAVRATQGGEVIALGLVAMGAERNEFGFAGTQMPEAPKPEDCPRISSESLQNVAALKPPPIVSQLDMRFALGHAPFDTSGEARTGGWLALADGSELDYAAITVLLDSWFPVAYTRSSGGLAAPTVAYTVDFLSTLPRANEPEGPLLGAFSSPGAHQGHFVEDGELWSQNGELVAVSRQHALVLPAQ